MKRPPPGPRLLKAVAYGPPRITRKKPTRIRPSTTTKTITGLDTALSGTRRACDRRGRPGAPAPQCPLGLDAARVRVGAALEGAAKPETADLIEGPSHTPLRRKVCADERKLGRPG